MGKKMIVFNKYFYTKQHDITDCGAACIATIMNYYGSKMSIAKIREIAGTDIQGTNIYGMVNAAKKLGFSVNAVKGDKTAFFSNFQLPCIAHALVDNTFLHYIVIYKVTKKEVTFIDPAKGLVHISAEDFINGSSSEKNSHTYKWTGVLILLSPSENFKKLKQTNFLVYYLLNMLKSQKPLLTLIFFISMLITLLGIIGSFYFRFLTNYIVGSANFGMLHVITLSFIVLNFFKITLNILRLRLLLNLSNKLGTYLFLGYYDHILELPMNFFNSRKTGEIISRFNDTSKIREILSDTILNLTIDIIMSVVGGFILYMQNKIVFLFAILVVFFYMLIIPIFNNRYKQLKEKQNDSSTAINSCIIETISGIQTIKAFTAQERFKNSTAKKFHMLLQSTDKLNWTSNLQVSIVNLVGFIGEISVLWFGAYQIMIENLTMGDLITYSFLLSFFLTPIKNLLSFHSKIQTAIVAFDRLNETFDLSPERSKNINKQTTFIFNNNIHFKNITFRYGTRDIILNEINLQIHKGERIALVGESGSGKTTLAKLLLNFYQVENGTILIDDQNIQNIDLHVLRSKISYISQDTFLFNGSIIENLLIGNQNATMKEIIDACIKAHAHEFIINLPLKYNTKLEVNGSNLSSGQRQRLDIARILLHKPEILILDEATSNLDAVTEFSVMHMLTEHLNNTTQIIITHRINTICNCDHIYVMKHGRLIEHGKHEQLLKHGGYYAELYSRKE